MLLVQAVNIHIERRPLNRFREAFVAALAFVILFVCLVFEISCYESQLGRDHNGRLVHLILIVFQLTFAAISLVTCFSLPRRPSVSSGGYVVDKQFTVSALSRSTYTWADELLKFAKKNNGLDLIHLPRLHFKVRSKTLEQNFMSFPQKEELWKKMMRVHWVELCAQSMLAIIQGKVALFSKGGIRLTILGLIQFAPQFAMYKLLELLEHRVDGEAIDVTAWGWVFGLGLSIVVTAWLEAFLHWVVWARLGLLVRSELSALIFSKSTRRKDVKGSQKAETAGHIEANNATEPTPGGLTEQTPTEPNVATSGSLNENPEEEVQKSRQSVINLIGIDTKRISDFATFHYIFSQSIAKLFASIFFLVKLIGWPSLLAGFAVSAISLPFNIWASRVFSRAQDELMKSRDQKMVVVTEALQGIRQIKFSALEQQWQDKIGKKRGEELAAQRKVFFADTALIALWILSPVMLSAVSLAVFALLHGELTPSIAFTTITIFAQIEVTLSIIPELTSDGLGKPACAFTTEVC